MICQLCGLWMEAKIIHFFKAGKMKLKFTRFVCSCGLEQCVSNNGTDEATRPHIIGLGRKLNLKRFENRNKTNQQ